MKKRWWEKRERRSLSMWPFVLLTIFLITLKVLGFIGWSWWWIFAPIWVPPVLGLVFLIFCAVLVMILDG